MQRVFGSWMEGGFFDQNVYAHKHRKYKKLLRADTPAGQYIIHWPSRKRTGGGGLTPQQPQYEKRSFRLLIGFSIKNHEIVAKATVRAQKNEN